MKGMLMCWDSEALSVYLSLFHDFSMHVFRDFTNGAVFYLPTMHCCLLLSCAANPAMPPFRWPIICHRTLPTNSRNWLRSWLGTARNDRATLPMISFWYYSHHALHVASSVCFEKMFFAQSHDQSMLFSLQLSLVFLFLMITYHRFGLKGLYMPDTALELKAGDIIHTNFSVLVSLFLAPFLVQGSRFKPQALRHRGGPVCQVHCSCFLHGSVYYIRHICLYFYFRWHVLSKFAILVQAFTTVWRHAETVAEWELWLQSIAEVYL